VALLGVRRGDDVAGVALGGRGEGRGRGRCGGLARRGDGRLVGFELVVGELVDIVVVVDRALEAARTDRRGLRAC